MENKPLNNSVKYESLVQQLAEEFVKTLPEGATVLRPEAYKPNPTDLYTQLLKHAALSSAYSSDKSARELIYAARMFFGADIVETARKLVISYNAQPDVGKPYPK